MTAPFFDAVSPVASLATAVAIGIAFGVALEQAGLGNAQKLSGQFYLRDFTVFKVMFSAILTAMLGVFWLDRIGVLDAGRLYVPETWLVPQIVGGLIFGAGFVLAGLCPGTSCVAAATGRIDGMMTVAGLFTGVLVTGFLFAPLRAFYESGAMGRLQLPSILHLSTGSTVFLIVAIALGVGLGAFAGVTRLERRLS
jgi:uncharacterized protein